MGGTVLLAHISEINLLTGGQILDGPPPVSCPWELLPLVIPIR